MIYPQKQRIYAYLTLLSILLIMPLSYAEKDNEQPASSGFQVPILLVIFNRPEKQQLVFEKIRSMRPTQLFIAADGPRNARDQEKCAQARAIAHQVDWPCELRVLFRDKNWGPGRAVTQSITWFFKHVQEGIILEDDCLPSTSFFYFCERMLELFRNDLDVYHVCGSNLLSFQHTKQQPQNFTPTYQFVGFANPWGWATWKRAWQYFNFDGFNHVQHEEINKVVRQYYKHPFGQKRLFRAFSRVLNSGANVWAYKWMYTILSRDGLSIVPSKNLIYNIGWDIDASGTKDKDAPVAQHANEEMHIDIDSIRHPLSRIPADQNADAWHH